MRDKINYLVKYTLLDAFHTEAEVDEKGKEKILEKKKGMGDDNQNCYVNIGDLILNYYEICGYIK